MKLFTKTLILLLFPAICLAHGLKGTVYNGGIVVAVVYDDGDPFNYAETKVIAPDNSIPFTSGWTDRNGRFCFYPDVEGEYTVIVKDGMGHQLEMKISGKSVPEDTKKNNNTSPVSNYGPRLDKMILAWSVIIILFGSLFWWKGYGVLKKIREEKINRENIFT